MARFSRRPAAFLIAVGALALAAAMTIRPPLKRLPAGSWAERDGKAIPSGWYFAWGRPILHGKDEPQGAQGASVKTAEGMEFAPRAQLSFAPARAARVAGAGPLVDRLAAPAFARLAAGWKGRPGAEILAADLAPEESRLKGEIEAAGFAVSRLKLQVVAPQSFVERFGRDLVHARSRPAAAPLLWVGYDGADWAILRRMLAARRLPNFARLLQGAAWGRMRPFSPIISPLLWTTMVTGKSPAEHNITDFVVQRPDGSIKPIGSNFRTVKALWEMAPLADRKTVFIDWWASYPAEESPGGVILSNVVRNLARAERPPANQGATSPEGYFKSRFAQLHEEYSLSPAQMAPVVSVTGAELQAARGVQAGKKPKEGKKVVQQEGLLVIEDAMSQVKGQTAEAAYLMRELKPDLTAVYYEGIDMMGHRFQHCMPPPLKSCSPGDAERFGGAVDRFYEYQDAALGRLLDAIGDKPYYVLLNSDHGFHNGADRPADLLPYTDENPVGWHREEAVFVLKGPGIKPGELPLAISIYDLTPTLLYLMGMPVASDFRGEVARAAIAPEFLRAHPVTTVRSYEELGAPRAAGAAGGNPEVEKELLASLARLGYVSPSTAASAGSAPAGSAPAEADEMTIGSRVNKAKFLMGEGRYDEALAELDRIPADKLKGRQLSLKVKALDEAGRKDEAAALLRKAQADKNAEEGSLLWLIQLDLRRGDIAQGEQDVKLAPADAAAAPLRAVCEGLLLEARGRKPEARAKFWAALRADPLQTAAAERLFNDLAPGERAEFAGRLAAGLQKDPQVGLYHYMRGVLLASAGRGDEALEAFRRAADAEPLVDAYALAYAAALAGAGRAGEGEALLASQTGRHPGNPELWESLANLRGMLGDFSAAAEAFGKAAAAGGSGARLYAGWAATLARTGRRDEARKALAEGLAKHPGDPALLGVKRQLGG